MATPDEFLRQMGRLSETLARLDALPRKVAEYAAPEITKAIKMQFRTGTDPYGRRWKRLADGRPSHLHETGRLERETRAAPLPGRRSGLRIIMGKMGKRGRNPVVHQLGNPPIMPARKILPERGMPAAWNVAIKRALRLAWREAQR